MINSLLKMSTKMSFKILVVDDEKDIRLLFALFLEKEGYEVDFASDGSEALQKIIASRPDLVISDIRMPVSDGYDLLRNATKLTPPKIPILFISGYAEGQENTLNENPNFVGFMPKPIRRQKFLDVVNKIKSEVLA